MPELLNPYHGTDGKPLIRKSVTAFLDILGFAQAIRNAALQGKQQEHLDALQTALTEAHRHFRADFAAYERFGAMTAAPYMIKVFTDNIVLGIPIYTDAESELGRMLNLVGNYQFTLAQHGFFVRGGITIGDMYMDENIAYGKALLEAYAAERSLARDPRVVLDPKLVKLVHQHLLYYDRVSTAPHNKELLCDSDGQLFVNYLMVPLDGDEPDAKYFALLSKHQQVIIEKLREFAEEPQYWSKYVWSGVYHNVVCTEFLKRPEYSVAEQFLRQPARVLDSIYERKGRYLLKNEVEVAVWKSESAVSSDLIKEENKSSV